MERAIVLFVVLLGALALSEARPLFHSVLPSCLSRRTLKAFQPVKDLFNARQIIKQSSSCESTEGYYFTDQTFLFCVQVFSDFGTALDDSTVNQFCSDNCGNYMENALNDIATACNDPSLEPDQYEAELFHQLCDHGAHQLTCLKIYDGFWSNTTVAPPYVNRCVQEFDPSGTCPNDCKLAENYVNKNIGCCFRALQDYEDYEEGEYDYFFNDEYWTKCGIKEPSLCTN